MRKKLAILYILPFFIISCHEKEEDFPAVKNLTEFKKTKFLTTLESKIDTSKNGIYAASLLFAWDEIRTAIDNPIQQIKNKELQLINKSKSYKKVLKADEYISDVEIEDKKIKASAYFKKSLPFEVPFDKQEVASPFLQDKVNTFGFTGPNNASSIVYYNNDDDFAIKLYPQDKGHEIILVKTAFKNHSSFTTELENLKNKKRDFEKSKTEKNSWKYIYKDDDCVTIPMIELNIENNYKNIEGSKFSTSTTIYNIETTYQRTAFVLNEKGAIVESEAEISITETCESMEEKYKPKELFFDKPFIIFLKRKDNPNPYFAMYVRNSELMKKVK